MDMPTSQAASRRATRWIRIVIKKLLVKHNGIIKQSRLRPFWPEWSDRDWTMFLKVSVAPRQSIAHALINGLSVRGADFHVLRIQEP